MYITYAGERAWCKIKFRMHNACSNDEWDRFMDEVDVYLVECEGEFGVIDKGEQVHAHGASERSKLKT